MSYSRRNYYGPRVNDDGSVPRITGLNAFGEPFRGKKIMGVGAEKRRIAAAYDKARYAGHPSQRKEWGSQAEFAEEKYREHDEAQRAAAVARGRAQAEADAARLAGAGSQSQSPDADKSVRAPKKPGTLVPGNSPGSSVWKTDEEIAADEKRMADARVEARKRRVTKGRGQISGMGRSVAPLTEMPLDMVA